MNLIFIYSIVILCVCLFEVNAVYNKDVTCIIDEGQDPICTTSPKIRRRSSVLGKEPYHDPYIPRNNTILYNCTTECNPVTFTSMTQLTSPNLFLKSCYMEISENDTYACETIRYIYFKNIDKLLFLSKTIPNKYFYLVDCLIYSDGGRVCHRKDNLASYNTLLDTGTLVRPNETNILSQDEFICEEDETKNILCDLNPFIPFESGLKLKQMMKFDDNVLLKTNNFVVEMKRGCIDAWCGYKGQVLISRRQFSYSPPGGKVFRCYYAHRQQVCKMIGYPAQNIYNKRSWLDNVNYKK